jgi:hypothetical protein
MQLAMEGDYTATAFNPGIPPAWANLKDDPDIVVIRTALDPVSALAPHWYEAPQLSLDPHGLANFRGP